jgi:cyclopropane-fatty-acyl-phospholipid synthase
MRALLDRFFRNFVVVGRICVRWPGGGLSTYTGEPGPEAAIQIHSWRAVRRLLIDPGLALGECYMDGSVTLVGCTIFDLLDVCMTNMMVETARKPLIETRIVLQQLVRRFAQFNPAGRSRRNVAHHYDLNGRLYSLFLDRDRQYSCAYFPRGDETLEEAQAAKKRHIAAKLRLDRPDLEVLDIGSGWGGLAITLARDFGARVTGITLSTEQLAEAQARVAAEGLSDRVHFELLDYRSLQRRFDRIVSVGMFEHVGVTHYREFLAVIRRCLAPDGVALVHSIGRGTPPSATNPWLAKYIFPGGYCPAMSEVFAAVEKSGLIACDVEILRLHYAETLRHWRRRFAANRDTIASIYDETFCRMFEFYLAGCELAFRRQGFMVWQLQLTRDIAALPMTRDYMVEKEREAASKARQPA